LPSLPPPPPPPPSLPPPPPPPPPAPTAPAVRCSICYDAKVDTVIVPCGHLCVCFECSKHLEPPARCPICRIEIEKIIKAFPI
jgi:hypothetical protein